MTKTFQFSHKPMGNIKSPHHNITIISKTNEAYALGAAALLTSIAINSKIHTDFTFYILTDGLSNKTVDRLKAIERLGNNKIFFKAVLKNEFTSLPQIEHLIFINYYSLKIPELFPEVNKAIYLDCDMITLSDISDLWEMDLQGYPIGAVKNCFLERHFLELGIKDDLYFNAGMLVMDLNALRKMDFYNKTMSFIKENPMKIRFTEQDAMNVVLRKKWFQIDQRWNYIIGTKPAENQSAVKDPAIVHFTGKKKPWMYRYIGNYKKEFRNYLKRTEFKDDYYSDYDLKAVCLKYSIDSFRYLKYTIDLLFHIKIKYIWSKLFKNSFSKII